jgi:predicted aconitase
VGEIVQERVPVLTGVRRTPNLIRLKHFGAAAASSGGVERYHIVDVTPEARSLKEAFGGAKPVGSLKYGEAERAEAYHNLNSSARDDNVDFVVLGCPHYSIEQVWAAARLLEGKKVHPGTHLWIFTPRAIKDIADRNGYTDIIAKAGATLMTDTCPCLGQVHPLGAKVVATDSAKQAHYLPAILGFETWFGSQADCIEAAITGRWRGELK